MRLLGEVKTLRKTVCASCQQKCLPTRSPGNQSLAAPNVSMRPLKQPHVEDALPRISETDIFWTPAATPGSSSPPINEKTASDSSSLVEMTTGRKKISNKSNDRLFYAERDALADPSLDVTFVDSFRHENSVRCVSFSRDGRYLAVGTGNIFMDVSIVIYQVESHKKYCKLREYDSQYGSYTRPLPWNLRFSFDGRYLAVSDAGRIVIWDVPKKRIRCRFHGSDHIFGVSFSPDGCFVAFWTGTKLLVLNVRDNSRRMSSEGSCFDFNPGGRLIATGKDDVLLILDVRTGKAVKKWNGHGAFLHYVKFILDGRGLLCVYDNMIDQWDVSDAEPVLIRKFDFQTTDFYRTCISPDHRLLAYSNQLWDVGSGKPRLTCKGHIDDDLSVDFSTTGTCLAMGSSDGIVSLWKYARS